MSSLTAHQKWALAGWAVSLVVSSVWIRPSWAALCGRTSRAASPRTSSRFLPCGLTAPAASAGALSWACASVHARPVTWRIGLVIIASKRPPRVGWGTPGAQPLLT